MVEVSQSQDKGTQRAPDEEEGYLQHAIEASFTQSTMAMTMTHQDTHAQIEPHNDRSCGTTGCGGRSGHVNLLEGVLGGKDSHQEGAASVVAQCKRTVSHDVCRAPSNEKHFNALQTGKTMKKYSGYWVSIVCYLWRTHKLPDAEAVAEDANHGIAADSELTMRPVGGKQPRYSLSAG